MPIGDALKVDVAFSTFEIVDIGHRSLLAARGGKSWNELGEFAFESKVGRCLGVDAGEKVHELGYEWGLMAVVDVDPPDTITGRLLSKIVFLSKGLL